MEDTGRSLRGIKYEWFFASAVIVAIFVVGACLDDAGIADVAASTAACTSSTATTVATNWPTSFPARKFSSKYNFKVYAVDDFDWDISSPSSIAPNKLLGETADGAVVDIPECMMWYVGSDDIFAEKPIADEVKSQGIVGLHLTPTQLKYLDGIDRLQWLEFSWVVIGPDKGASRFFTDADISQIAKLKELGGLSLRKTQINGSGLEHLKNIKGLQFLDISRTKITGKNFNNILNLKELRSLNIAGTMIGDRELAKLRELNCLEHLNVGGMPVTDAGLSHLSKLNNLKSIDLYGCVRITPAGLAKLADLKQLQSLSLNYISTLNSDCLAKLAELKSLRELSLCGVKAMNNNELAKLVAALPELRKLNIAETAVDGDGLKCLSGLKDLQSITVGLGNIGLVRFSMGQGKLNGSITDVHLKSLEGLSELQEVGLSGTVVSDAGVASLKMLKKLKSLTLIGTKITSASTQTLKEIASLKKLWISGLTKGDIEEIKKSNPGIRVFDVSFLFEELPATPEIPNAQGGPGQNSPTPKSLPSSSPRPANTHAGE